MESDELSLRVGQLGSAETRMRLARALRAAAALASRQPEPLASRSGASEIQASRALLLGLAEAVGGGLPVGVEGLAKASLLVSSSSSPLYHAGTNPTLAVALHDSLDALHRGHRTVSIAR